MSSAHLCVRNVLTQAFRLPVSRSNAPSTTALPDFLVPALARPRRRPFSSAKRRRAHNEAQTTSHKVAPERFEAVIPGRPQKPLPESTVSKIPFPTQHDRGDIESWLAAIDPFLPPHLRRDPSNEPDRSSSITPLDLAKVISATKAASLDILGHIGLVERRWTTLVWISKKLVEDGKHVDALPAHLGPLHTHMRSELDLYTLTCDELTQGPIVIGRNLPSRESSSTLDILTTAPGTNVPVHRIVKEAIGQLWRSMGELVLVAAEDDREGDDAVMTCVLEIIAHLHHTGFIPDSVYSQKENEDSSALLQPPTLPLLSTQILTALSDATWRAHEASVKAATENSKATYFLGHEIPGSRYKLKAAGLGPELWLELILWSCVHGGWVLDASAILERVVSSDRKRAWGLISWRELLQAKLKKSDRSLSEKTVGWGLFKIRQDNTAQPEDRAQTRMTVSSEIVTAVVDGLVNSMRLGVGNRGTAPEQLIAQIKNLKQFLDTNNLSLGSTTWDAIVSRLVESGGLVPENRPELLLEILGMASSFGKEVSSINAPPKEDVVESEPPYFFEPTTVPLTLFHRVLRYYFAKGDIQGAMSTVKMLQQFTDRNKQKSLEEFFEALKNMRFQKDGPTTRPIEFPAFHPQLPPPLLAKLLDLATESKMYDVGRSLLFSDDLDGPLIHPGLYSDWMIGASIIRFGTMAGENDLVLKIVGRSGTMSTDSATHRISHDLLTALFCSQIKLHRWNSIRGMQEYVLANPGYRLPPEILSTFAAELLRSTSKPPDSEGEDAPPPPLADNVACHAFTDFLFRWEHLILHDLSNELYSTLAILSTVSTEWKLYCAQFLSFSASQGIKLRVTDFNRILGGIADAYGSSAAREAVQTWCYTASDAFAVYTAPGGLSGMPRYRVDAGHEIQSRPAHIEIVHPSGETSLVLKGRIRPNRQTIRIIVDKVKEEEVERRQGEGVDDVQQRQQEQVRETLRWALGLLCRLGAEWDDAVSELGEFAEFVGVERFTPPSRFPSAAAAAA